MQGGKTRAESVLNALETIKENSLVVVHDAVRPFINSDMIRDLMREILMKKQMMHLFMDFLFMKHLKK